ncbi:MAG: alpha/beta fold hydrolase [Chloroflexi bacterium]|nr:alpha/beta fold hydrolase [Chloroflexota bacterium]
MSETRPVTIPCGDIALEAVVHLPAGKAAGAVVVCHPHPMHGGDMHNHVVVTLCRVLAESGLAALRFNFRGTGRSGGRHEEDSGEQQDVVAALKAAAEVEGVDGRLGLAGYSFGAVVAAQAASQVSGLGALVLVSPPAAPVMVLLSLEASGDLPSPLSTFTGPKLLIAGDADVYARPRELKTLAEGLGPSCELVLLPGVDHFWSSGFENAAARVAAFFRKSLRPPG